MPRPTKPAGSSKPKATSKPAKPPKSVKPAPSKGKGKAPAKAESDSDSEDSFNSSESEDDEDEEAGSSQEAMLAALEAHTRSMLGLPNPAADDEDDDSDGDSDVSGHGTILESDEDEGFHTDDGWGAGDAFVSDSEDELGAIDAAFQSAKKKKKTKETKETKTEAPKPAAPTVPEVVFAPTSSSSASMISNSEKRAFLKGNSAKMMGIKNEEAGGGRGKKRAREADDEEEASNLRLDKTLHDMLLTTILPSAESDAASRPVEKRNALSGRLLELASYSLPGEGSSKVRGADLSSHPAHVRTGLLHAAQRRSEKARAESEAAGSWVKGIGGLGDMGKRGAGARPTGVNAARGVRTFGLETGKKKGMDGKKAERARGLGMGVGSYKHGTLTISERDIARVNNLGKGGVRKKGKRK